jgi:DNA-binding GntR family transcriptional regulator
MHTDVHTLASGASANAYQELKSQLLLGRIPIGIRLREERLAERLGCSRTPVREAVLRLSAERFLERHPQGGYCVAAPRVHTMRELYEVRRALELFAVHRGCDAEGGHDRDVLARLQDEWDELDARTESLDGEFVLIDESFHIMLAEAAGNQHLADELHRINEHIRPVRTHDFVSTDRIAATIDQHREILAGVLARDATRAATLLDRHIRESQAEVEVRVASAIDRMLESREDELPW